MQSLSVETNEQPLDMMRKRLSLQYCVKLMSNEVNPAYAAVFVSDIVAKPLGLRCERPMGGVRFYFPPSCQRSIYGDENSTMKTICFELCVYEKNLTVC